MTEPPADRRLVRAVGLHRFGDPDVLDVVHVPLPAAGAGEVVVRVAAATVNPTDVLLRSGGLAAGMEGLTPPYIPGMDLAGVVHEVGAGVTTLQLGQPVIAIVDPLRTEGGAQAEYVAVPAASVVSAPGEDLVAAATVPMNGLTALMTIEALDASPGDVVLITGGAGALGGYAIQLARYAGLRVVADAKEADVSLLRTLGADEVVPRGDGMAAAVRDLHPDGVDAIVDAARIGSEATALVRDGGRAVLVRRTDSAERRLRSHNVFVGARLRDTAALQRLAELTEAGRLTPRVAVRMPFERAAEAHRLLEQGGLRGRIVLEPAEL